MLVAAKPLPLAPVETWRPVSAETSRLTGRADLERLAIDFPNSANVWRRLIAARFQAKDRAGTIAGIEKLHSMGYPLRGSTYDGVGELIGKDEAARFKAAGALLLRQAGASQEWLSIPASVKLSEGFAYDAKRKTLFSSAVVDRKIYKVAAGKAESLPHGPLGSTFGLALDPKARLLWAGSGRVEQTPAPQIAFTGLIALDSKSGAERRRVAAGADVLALNDISVGPDGTVYASDSMGGGVYRLGPKDSTIGRLIAPGVLRGPQGIAVEPGGRRLFVADYGYGIATVDLATGKVGRLAAPDNVMLDGTDGLIWHNGSLIAIQNGIQPPRVVRLQLDSGLSKVVGATVLEQANPAWGDPALGQIVPGGLLYSTDAQWERFGEGGVMKGTEPLRPNVLRFIALPDAPKKP